MWGFTDIHILQALNLVYTNTLRYASSSIKFLTCPDYTDISVTASCSSWSNAFLRSVYTLIQFHTHLTHSSINYFIHTSHAQLHIQLHIQLLTNFTHSSIIYTVTYTPHTQLDTSLTHSSIQTLTPYTQFYKLHRHRSKNHLNFWVLRLF